MDQVVKVIDVSKLYLAGEQTTRAVQNMNLSLRKGEMLALLGPNGAGKSTMIKMILNLTRPTSGQISIQGEYIRRNPGVVGKNIGYLPEMVNFYPNLSVRETINFVAGLKKMSQARAQEALQLVGIKDIQDKKVGALSKGMLQRLALAQASMGQPPILILDEPISGLDPLAIQEYKQILIQLHQSGTSILFSSHDLGVARELADRIAIMTQGSLVALDTLEKIYELGTNGVAIKIKLKTPKPQYLELALAAGAASAEFREGVLVVHCPPGKKLAVLQSLQKDSADAIDFTMEDYCLEEAFIAAVSGEGSGRQNGSEQHFDSTEKGI